MELTDIQKRKIEESRAKALAILEAKKRDHVQLVCQFQTDNPDSTCYSKSIDAGLYEAFGEKVCSVCKLHNEDFDMISRGDAVSHYLVTDDALTTLKHKTRDNPHNPGWTPMRLYLRKHVHALSMKKFGTEDKLAAEKKEREAQKYERFLLKTGDTLSNTTKELREEMNAHPVAAVAVSAADNSDNKRKRGAQTEMQKKKKAALGSLVNIIRGNQS